MIIECSQINQTVNYLLTAFQDCNKIKNEDLRLLVELVSTVNECANGGPPYNTEVQEVYEPLTNTVVDYPINTFHSVSVNVIEGNISQTINSTTVIYPTGTSLNTEYTNLNQTNYTFTVLAGSTVAVSYLIETI